MIRHRYYIGTLTRDGASVSDEQRAKVKAQLCEVYGGYTVYATSGAWSDHGTVKVEPSEVYEELADRRPVDPANLAALLATLASQTCVLWTEETVNGGFAP